LFALFYGFNVRLKGQCRSCSFGGYTAAVERKEMKQSGMSELLDAELGMNEMEWKKI